MTVQVRRPADRRFSKTLIFSPAGHGKTHILGTAQEDERTNPMLLLDFEGGDETLAGLDLDLVSIRGWDDYSEVYEALSSGEHWKLPGATLEEGQTYKSLGIDSASETHIWALLTRLEQQAPRRNDPDLIEIGDYGVAGTQLRRLLREFRDLPMHVFFTAGSKEVKERGVGQVKVPSLSGQMAEEIVHIMSIVGYLAMTTNEESGDPERLLLLQNYPGFRTKVRAPWRDVAPDEIVDPTITKLLDELKFENVSAGPDDWPGRKVKRTRKQDTKTSSNGDDPEGEAQATPGDEAVAETDEAEPEEAPKPARRRAGRARASS